MQLVWTVVIGALFATGLYMVLRRSVVKIILGIGLLAHAANLLIFTAAGLTRAVPPLVAPAAETLTPPYADPVPQALVLTAIVIGFGVTSFALVLFKRTYAVVAADDIDQLRSTEI
jgi:multicomponent Na+:H+ antiporter subunit C